MPKIQCTTNPNIHSGKFVLRYLLLRNELTRPGCKDKHNPLTKVYPFFSTNLKHERVISCKVSRLPLPLSYIRVLLHNIVFGPALVMHICCYVSDKNVLSRSKNTLIK